MNQFNGLELYGRCLDSYKVADDPTGFLTPNNPQAKLPVENSVGGAEAMQRGGIVGEVEITHCVGKSGSRWFTGPYGLVRADAQPMPFVRCRAMLGLLKPCGV